MKSDSQFPYSGPVFLQFKISSSLIRAYPVMTSINMSIRKLRIQGNVSSVLVLYCTVHSRNISHLLLIIG